MKSSLRLILPLALLLVNARVAWGGEPPEKISTIGIHSTHSTTSAPASQSTSSSVPQLNVTSSTTPPSTSNVTNVTQTVPIVMEGSGSTQQINDLSKDVPSKKVELNKSADELSDSFPLKEPNKSSVVKPRKGVNMSDASMSTTLCPGSDKCLSAAPEEPKASSGAPPITTLPSQPYHTPNVTADAPDQQKSTGGDYVIPIIGIIFVVPLAAILITRAYKKGLDLWERRHYRPMDFLIDGIYNNQ